MPSVLGVLFAALALSTPRLVDAHRHGHATALETCRRIERGITRRSDVAFPLLDTLQYEQGTSHFMTSSTQLAECVFFPGSPADVAVGLRAIRASRTPFAVKGGGHASNPGFSSTTGVQFTMSRFNKTVLSKDKRTVEIGAGLLWDDVYRELENTVRVNVVGGRVTGVGVAGFILGGGGYSYLSNSHGLTVDTVEAFKLVLPDGTITTVTAANKDLFFALKGGQNNFGIVTSFVLRTVPQQPLVYGGLAVYGPDQLPGLLNAIERFSAQFRDPKAVILPTINHLQGAVTTTVIFFYNGPNPPASTFSDFDALVPLFADLSQRSYLSLVSASPTAQAAGRRGVFHTVSTTEYSGTLLQQIANQTAFYGQEGLTKSGFFISYAIEPFLPSYFSKSRGGAYPHLPSRPLLPLNIYYAWTDSSFDTYWHDSARASARLLTAQAIAEGQPIKPEILYPNYAIYDTPLKKLYGTKNLAKLRKIKKRIDRWRVMDLAGGFKI